jgi:UDP-N-acetyl-D-mannosaminuronic acid dehydrogenase
MKDSLELLYDARGPIRNIGVIGMGYVGIPSALLFADIPKIEHVWGFQRVSKSSGYKIEMLNRGESPLKGEEPGIEDLLRKVVEAGTFCCTDDFSRIAEVDAVTLAIQTPFLNPSDLIPDFSALREALIQVGRYLTEGMLVVLESTVTPGTTNGWVRALLEEESGLVAGEEFALAHAPERVMVGRLLRNIREHDRIVGGINDASTRRAMELYRPVLTKGAIITMTATAAEVTKTAENTFRDLQIAAVNQLALYCEAIGVNVYDVRSGIDSLKGEGITRAVLHPGAGVGGHCLTKDTYHLERGAREQNADALDFPPHLESLYVTARAINDFMPQHMVTLTEEALKRIGSGMEGTTIALLGWAFISNSDDARNTPSEVYRNLCMDRGAEVRVHDPYVRNFPGVHIVQDLVEVIRDSDAIAIFTAHDTYQHLDAPRVKELCRIPHPVIVDGRNVIDPDLFIREGFLYKGIGRGDRNMHPVVSHT